MPMRRDTNHTLRQLFLARVEITDGCWFWRGSLTVHGYGRLQYMNKSLRAHRVAYELFIGPIDEGMEICHHCDNGVCVRPDHLFQGTIADNLHDMVGKGRSLMGERNTKAKVSDQDVIEIRQRYAKGNVTQQELADLFGLKQITVSNIVLRKTWQHLDQEQPQRKTGKSRLTPDEVRAIRQAEGTITMKALADQYHVYPSTISGIWARKIWKDIPD